MLIRIALCIATVIAALAPAAAADSMLGLAPADEYFGRYNLSVLGIANSIRDAGARIDAGTDPERDVYWTAVVRHRCDPRMGARVSERSVDREGSPGA